MKPDIVLIAHNLRSCHNVGSLLRTAEGLGVSKVWLTGYTPYPKHLKDKRLGHLSHKIHSQIHKTALGAEELVDWEYTDSLKPVMARLKTSNYVICALEQTADAIEIHKFLPPGKIALVVGREVEGLESEILNQVDTCLVIPMFGKKESFNVAVAAAIGLYHLRFSSLTAKS